MSMIDPTTARRIAMRGAAVAHDRILRCRGCALETAPPLRLHRNDHRVCASRRLGSNKAGAVTFGVFGVSVDPDEDSGTLAMYPDCFIDSGALNLSWIVEKDNATVFGGQASDDCTRAVRAAAIRDNDLQSGFISLTQEAFDDPFDVVFLIEAGDSHQHVRGRLGGDVRDARGHTIPLKFTGCTEPPQVRGSRSD